MAVKQFVSALLFILFLVPKSSAYLDEESSTRIIDGLIVRFADGLAGKDKCGSIDLPESCTITGDCSQITCSSSFGGESSSLTVNINRCDEPVTVTINVKVREEDIDWTHVFTSGDELPVPGLREAKIFGAELYIKASIEPKDSTLTLKVTLRGGTMNIDLIDQKLPISTDYCGFVRWWESRDNAGRIALLVASAFVALSIVSCCFCCGCCCCCRCCRKKNSGIV
nr:uncharacterized protein LOC131792241 [Pocillopora verrucosa]